MGLKLKIEKLEDVEEAQRSLYVEDKEGGGFILVVEGLEDTGALKRAKEHEKAEHDKTKAELKKVKDGQQAAADAARKAAEDAARAAGNVEALEKSWKEKLDKANGDWQQKYDTEVGSLTSDVKTLLIDNVAKSIAGELAVEGSAGVLIPHIASRLAVEVREGKRVTVVKDAEGKASALTTDELKKEFAGNKAFAPVLVGSKASGGGASGKGTGGGAPNAKTLKRPDYDALDVDARKAHLKAGGAITD